MDITQTIRPDLENTSTWDLARALFSSSWQHNDGKTVTDEVLFDSLEEIAVTHLIDTAAAAEELLKEYANEPYDLLVYNTAATLYEAYTHHPYSADPGLPWESAPQDLQMFWTLMAKDFMQKWKEVKHKTPYKGWFDVEKANVG